MNKNKSTICIILIVLFLIIFYLGMQVGARQENKRRIRTISMEDYHRYLDDNTPFVLVVERPSCRFCAIVTSAIYQIEEPGLPIYLIDLEPFWGTEEYDLVKRELQVNYLPSIKYIEGGEIKYNMNSPLDSGYYESDGERRRQLYQEMEYRIHKFIAGAIGEGPVVDEPVLQDLTLQGIPESKEAE